MNLNDTAEISRSSIVKQHIMDWKAWKIKHTTHECSDERLLAGCYLAWARGDVESAEKEVAVHCSGDFVDHPPFFRCQETLEYLRQLKKLVLRR